MLAHSFYSGQFRLHFELLNWGSLQSYVPVTWNVPLSGTCFSINMHWIKLFDVGPLILNA